MKKYIFYNVDFEIIPFEIREKSEREIYNKVNEIKQILIKEHKENKEQ